MARESCWQCHVSLPMCYCADIEAIQLPFEFVILTHPLEFRRRIATGRMAHRCISNSRMITAENYTDNAEVNAMLADPTAYTYLMHPKAPSLCLNDMSLEEKRTRFLIPDKKVRIFVVDGTWATARKTMRLSTNLHHLPRICFRPSQESSFRVRKQPEPEYVSTIEAIHQSIELLKDLEGRLEQSRPHDNLLKVFDRFVERQLAYVTEARRPGHVSRYQKAREVTGPLS